jgi:riboflavin kinase/FMN adenylyltransferase
MLTGEEFVHDIVIQGVGARHVFVGTNFHFGRGGEGDVDLLKREGVKHGLKVGKVDVVLFDSRPISSTRIRDNIRKGNVERVAGMLGRHHTLSGRGVEGKHRGKALGFSTANLTTNSELIPRNGVYATRTEFAGTNHISVTNIGIRPTFDEKERVIETHILDYAGGPLYGRTIRVQFCTRLRDEIRFDSPEDLKKQIVDDVATTRSWFAENPLPR